MAVVVALSIAAAALAQRRFEDLGYWGRSPAIHNVPYDGRFTFVRIQYETAPGGYWAGGRPSWVHGYPIAEENLMRIMNDISYLGPHTDDVNVLTLDDPELFKYPIAYIIEVGWWTLTDIEAAALRTYIQKGGFVIVDDFKMLGWRGNDTGGWEPFAANMQRVLGRAFLRDGPVASDLSLVLRNRCADPRELSAGLQQRPPDLPRRLRGQRPAQTARDDRELQHRHLAVLGMVGTRVAAGGRYERSVQARCELSDVRNDTLTTLGLSTLSVAACPANRTTPHDNQRGNRRTRRTGRLALRVPRVPR